MISPRAYWVAACAIGGAVLSVVFVPSLLDSIFMTVQRLNRPASSRIEDSGSVAVFEFEKLVIDDPKKGIEGDREEAERVRTEALARRSSLAEVASGLKGIATLSVFQASGKKIEEERALGHLKLLSKVGDIGTVVEDLTTGQPALYRYIGQGALSEPRTVPDETAPGWGGSRLPHVLAALALLGAILGASLGNLAIRFIEFTTFSWVKMETGEKVNFFIGVFTGIVGSLPFLIAFGNLGPILAPLLTLGLTVGFSLLSFQALKSMQDVLPWTTGSRRGRKSGIKVLDTNVLIDGRIYDVARTGFIEGDLYVPRFVLLELQHIADSSDSLRRQRGRRGLEVLRHLQAEFEVTVGTHDRHAPDESEEVDSRLVRLAKAIGADLVSNDYNLNRVASIQDVRVLNLNDLTLALRPTVLPGETMDLQIIREGNQPGQGVGYLDDGTMVVVEQAKPKIGELVSVVVTQVIQTERGKLIFAELAELADSSEVARRRGAAPRTEK
ncbi:MAG: TRAM domain-containing protein [Fimbriimonadaceae bacterium]|nr:TRAM domain-containing protein [Fimbriimonadaceae bacterium]QYK57644.1 MAG: TRAM domain-containing protein [Fimbriimonadaceae bacterium]